MAGTVSPVRRALLLGGALLSAITVVAVDTASAVGPAPVRRSADSSDPRATDQIIVKLVDGSTPDLAALAAAAGEPVSLKRQIRHGAWVSKLSGRRSPIDAAAIAARISALPGVAYAEPDAILFPIATPTDPRYVDQWDLAAPTTGSVGANLPAAWDITQGTSDVVVAVIDTGITNHADLVGQTVPGYDFISDINVANDGSLRDADPSDPGDWITSADAATATFRGCPVGSSSWHGTHVAGTIAALSNNGTGVAGIASGVKILPIRVLGKCGGFTSDIVDGMRWAAGLSVAGLPSNPNPAAVENLSLGGAGACSVTQQQAINDIVAVGTTVVVAAGNSNVDALNSNPANCNNVITVAATGTTGSRAYYSNFGSLVEIAAPGGDMQLDPAKGGILSTLNAGTTVPAGDTYAYYQGTSMATPHVVGVAALVKSVQPSITPAAMNTLLRSTATAFPAGSTCTVTLCGPGILNAGSAVASAAAANGPRVLGAFAKTAPVPGATGIGTSATLTWTPSAGATGYEYCLVVGVATPCTTWTSVGSATSAAVTGLTGGSVYAWQVRATDGTNTAEANVSLRSTFTTVTPVALPLAFNKTAPANAAVNSALTASLTWGASTGATSYEYCLDAVVNSTCDGTWVSTGTTRSATPTGRLNSTRYEWQVRSRNAGGTTLANAGTWWTFTTVAATPPGAFNKTAPANNATGRTRTNLALSWGASTNATKYEYCVDTVNDNVCNGTWVSTGTTRSATITGLGALTAYYWQVRSTNAAGLTTLANTGIWWRFTTA